MIGRKLDDITAADLSALIANAVREARTIEYKLALPGGSDADKREFLADVSSFANAAGGDILYGVAAASGVPTRVAGIQNLDADKETLRLENIIRDGLDPRIPGVRVKVVEVPGAGGVLVIRVPRSWSGPHMVTFKDASRFFARSTAGKFQMDTHELRSAFGMSADFPMRIRAWRDDRIAKILSGEGPVRMPDTPKVVLHIVSVNSLDDSQQIAASDLDSMVTEFPPIASTSWDNRINLDGLLTYRNYNTDPHKGTIRSYCQVFRSGRVEAVYSDIVADHAGRRVIGGTHFEKILLESTARYIKSFVKAGVQLPMAILVAFLGVRGVALGVNIMVMHDVFAIDRDPLILPEVYIDEQPKNLPATIRPIFDAVWNACGVPKSANYDENGRWEAASLLGVPMEESP